MTKNKLSNMLQLMFKPHPWHGITAGEKFPEEVNAYIEIVPTDTVKYEIDKASGYLKVDRPQKYSNICPTLYGFVPQTYCGTEVGKYCEKKIGRTAIDGDGDPLDICVLSERVISHGDILLKVIPIGGIRMIDKNQADDKIIAVLRDDAVYGKWQNISDCPVSLIDRLKHYFLTYKELPQEAQPKVEITNVYSRQEAVEVIQASIHDYRNEFGDPHDRMNEFLSMLRKH